MTQPQLLAFLVLAGTMVMFISGRLRYDLVSVTALLAAVLTGIVPHDAAFSGFGDNIVVVVASALIVSAAIERSGVVEAALHRVPSKITSVQGQIITLVTTVAVLSALVKNIGALAMMMPVAFQMARRSNASPSALLMPMAFASLLGGMVTLIGTSPNIIVSRMRAELTGQPFGMFDFAPVGLGLAIVGTVFLALGYRLLPSGRKRVATMDEGIGISDYMTEARLVAKSSVVGHPVSAFAKLSDHEIAVTGVIRNKSQHLMPAPDLVLLDGDIVLLEGSPEALERAVARAHLELEGTDRPTEAEAIGEIGGIEAVIRPGSILIGQTAKRMAVHERYRVNLLAVSRSGERFNERLGDIMLRPGDVLLLKGDLALFPEKLKELGILPLAEREIRLGNVKQALVPVTILGGAIGLSAFGVLPVATALFGAAVLMILFGALSLREAYDAIDWPILVMLGALIPVSDSIRTTGGADLLAGWLSQLSSALPPWAAIALIMTAAMAITPFLNNAATALVMAPLAVTFAGQLGYKPDAFLMAVAVGAACDFLTPIGHQCNTLVMGPGGYRFGDYWRLGLPLSLIVISVGVPLILLMWPVT